MITIQDRLAKIVALVGIVVILALFVLASCAPPTPQLNGPNTTAYIGEYYDADHNFICYHTFTPPIQMQCFDLDRR